MKTFLRTALLVWAFLLPWQARLILREGIIGGEPWQYGTISVSVAEALLGILLLVIFWKVRPGISKVVPFVFFAIIILFGVWRAEDSVLAASRAVLILGVLLLAYAAFFDDPSPQKFAYAFLLGMLPQALLGIAQFFLQEVTAATILGTAAHHASILGDSVIETSTGRYLRAYGSFPHPNVFGGFAAVALILSAWLAAQVTRQSERLFASVSFLLNTAALFFTFSRSAWIAAAAGLTFLFFGTGWRKSAPIILSAILLSFLLAIPTFSLLKTRVAVQGRLEKMSITERVEGASLAWRVFRKEPMFGTGIGNGTLALARTSPGSPIWQYQPPHNAALAAIIEVGLLGFAALLGILASLFRGTWSSPLSRALAVTLASAGLFDHFLWTTPAGLGLLGFGILLALRGTPLDKPPPRCILGA